MPKRSILGSTARSRFKSHVRLNHAERRTRLSLERLEGRTLLAYTATLNFPAQTVSFDADSAGDVLVFDVDPSGRLQHNRFTAHDPGFASNIDLDSTTPGVQSSPTAGSVPNRVFFVTVHAGDGNDTIRIGTPTTPASVFDEIIFDANGQLGSDALFLDDSANGVGADSAPVSYVLTDITFGPVAETFLQYFNFENLTISGGSGPENVEIQNTADETLTRLNGGGGNDIATVMATGIAGLILDGQAGNDTAVIVFGNLNGPVSVVDYGVTFSGTDGNNSITLTDTTLTADQTTIDLGASFVAPTIVGGDGDDTIDASARTRPANLDGGRGSDTIIGSSQSDTITGGDGNDVLTGGGGSDRFVFAPNWGQDTVDADATNDMDTMDFSAVPTRLFVTLGSVSVGDEFGNTSSSDGNRIETVVTGAGDDAVNCLATTQKLVVQLGDGADFVDCSNSSQIMQFDGGPGDDSITGGSSDDVLIGGAGDDVIEGGGGNDAVAGGAGLDTLTDSVGTNTLAGGLGCDTINGVVDPPSCANPTVQFGGSSFSVNEGAKLINIPVTLSAVPAGAVSVTYTVTSGSATTVTDYTAKNGTLTFSPTQLTRIIAIKIKNDKIDEDDETVALALTGVSGAIMMGDQSAATLFIRDDDATPTARFLRPTASVRESAGFVALTVTLSAPSGRAITLGLTTGDDSASDGSDYAGTNTRGTPVTVTIAAGQRAQVVQISISNDSTDEPNETFVAHLGGPINTTVPAATANVTVTILDDDVAVAAIEFGRRSNRRLDSVPLARFIDLFKNLWQL